MIIQLALEQLGALTSCDVENPHITTGDPPHTRIPAAQVTLKQHGFELCR